MKILIDNSGYELKNFGDIAMLLATVERLLKFKPNCEIYVLTDEPHRLLDISPNVQPIELVGRRQWFQSWTVLGGLHKLCPEKLKHHLKYFEFLFKSNFLSLGLFITKYRMKNRGHDLNAINDFVKLFKSVDLVLVTGGGFVNDEFSVHAQNVLRTLYLAQKLKKRTAMIGQGLGPISTPALIAIAKKVFPCLEQLALRESIYSYDIAKSLGVRIDRLTVTGDDAITLAYSNRREDTDSDIGFNLRLAKYSSVSDEFSEKVRDCVELFVKKNGGKIIPITISTHKGDSDIDSLEKLLNIKISNDALEQSLSTVIECIGHCKIVITGSYHAGVFALSQGIPIIGIAASDYYRQKFEGIIGQFGNDFCKVLEPDDTFDYDDFENMVKNLIDKTNQNRLELLRRVEEQINNSEQVLEKIIESH